MPIYEYRCKDCGREFEYQQRMSDAPKTVCESCNGSLEKLISRSSFHLKGGGWYKDLYSSTKKEASPSGDGSAAADKKSEAASSSDSASTSESSSKSDSGTSASTSSDSAS